MNMNRLKLALPYITIVLFVVSVVGFLLNNGFKYNDYENYIRVQVNGDQNVDAFVEKLVDSNGLIEIDRVNNFAYYQHIELSTVEETVSTVKQEYPEVVITTETVYPSITKRERIIDVALITTLVMLLFIGFSYVTKSRSFNWDLKEYAKYYGFYILDNILAIGILAGAVSLLSLVYKINDYVLFAFFVVVIIKTLIFWFKLLDEDIAKMKSSFVLNFLNDYKKLFVIGFITIVLLAAGMGIKSVLPLGMFVVAIVLASITDYSILTFELPKFRRAVNNQIENKAKTEAKPEKTEKKYVPNPKLKKKNKPKKK